MRGRLSCNININPMQFQFYQVYLLALALILPIMILLWLVSIPLKNVSIVDLFWGSGFVLTTLMYFLLTEGFQPRKIILLVLVSVWGLRLSIYLAWRNHGKGEDFRYRKFREQYGDHRYWWISFFQTFLLQGVVMWLVSAPLLGAQFYRDKQLWALDYVGFSVWLIGFIFQAGGDLQLALFKADPSSRNKVLDKGFWRYTRHPNYFGESVIWVGYGLICIAAGSYIPILGSILMIALIIKVSGVALLEKQLKETKPQYKEYIENTSTFFPWCPKSSNTLEIKAGEELPPEQQNKGTS